MFIIGFLSTGVIIGVKLIKLYSGLSTILVTDNPLFYIALATMIIGTQLFLAGFLGEIILRNRPNQDNYKISETVND
jgi:NhaP-type Na+/H+ and K+/H+ antiporter